MDRRAESNKCHLVLLFILSILYLGCVREIGKLILRLIFYLFVASVFVIGRSLGYVLWSTKE